MAADGSEQSDGRLNGRSCRFRGLRLCDNKQGGKWEVQTSAQGSSKVNLGRYIADTDAARAFDAGSYALRGSLANLNFPLNYPPYTSEPPAIESEIPCERARQRLQGAISKIAAGQRGRPRARLPSPGSASEVHAGDDIGRGEAAAAFTPASTSAEAAVTSRTGGPTAVGMSTQQPQQHAAPLPDGQEQNQESDKGPEGVSDLVNAKHLVEAGRRMRASASALESIRQQKEALRQRTAAAAEAVSVAKAAYVELLQEQLRSVG